MALPLQKHALEEKGEEEKKKERKNLKDKVGVCRACQDLVVKAFGCDKQTGRGSNRIWLA